MLKITAIGNLTNDVELRAFCMVQSVIGCLVYDRNRCSL